MTPMTTRTVASIMASVAVSAILLAACAKPAPPAESPPGPAGEPAASAPTESAAPVDPEPAAAAPNESSTSPPSADPPAAANDPALESMKLARPSAKMGVAADVRYQLDGPLAQGQSGTLHLAVVPRIARAPVHVSITEDPGLTISAGAANLQKVDSRDVYRQQFAVTRATASATQIRVLVTMDVAEGTGFGFFTIPLDSGTLSK